MTNKVAYPTNVPYVSTNIGERSLPGFRLERTEVYLNHLHTEPHTLLMGLKYTDAQSGTTYMQDCAGWIKSAGKGKIIYLMPGHTVSDFEKAAYGRIVLNALIYK
jgi:type 1 glutamine amidotransferase